MLNVVVAMDEPLRCVRTAHQIREDRHATLHRKLGAAEVEKLCLVPKPNKIMPYAAQAST